MYIADLVLELLCQEVNIRSDPKLQIPGRNKTKTVLGDVTSI